MARRRAEPRSKRARGTAPARPAAREPAATSPAADRAARVLWITLLALAAARLALPFDRTTWTWALDPLRYLPPVPAAALALVAVAGLVPALARRVSRPLAWLGDAADRAPALVAGGWGLALAALVWALPDRVRFVGDFLLRQGTVEEHGDPGVLFPQALPLDVLLHVRLPLALNHALGLDASTSARLVGALEAALLGVLAVGLVRVLALRGAAAAAAVATLSLGGTLGLLTGYSKAACELALLVGATGVWGLAFVRRGRGGLALGVVVALGIALHRAGVALLLPLAVAWWLQARAGRPPWRDSWALAGLAVVIASLALFGPRIVHTFLHVDVAVHLEPGEVRRGGGVLAAMFAGTRPADMLNLVALLAPTAFAVPFLVAAFGRALPRGRELAFLGALALPFVLLVPVLHPAQGIYRDWDNDAAGGIALALAAAWLAAEALRAAPARGWVAVALACGLASHTVAWLAVHADTTRGLDRVEAFVTQPPRRTDTERATTWDFLGIRHFRLAEWEASARAFSHAAETAPSPRILQQWALAATRAERLDEAQHVYRRLLAKEPGNRFGLLGLAAVSSRMGDEASTREAVRRLLEMNPADPQALQIERYWEERDSARAAAR